jgi:hypothetical protein
MLKSASRSALVAAVSLTLVYVAALCFYPQRDVLILWERDFSAPRVLLAALCLALAGYAALLWLLLRPAPADVSLSNAQKTGLLALFVTGGLLIQLLATAITEGDPFAGIARRTFAWATGGYWTVGAPVEDVRDFVGRYAERAPTYPVHQSRHPPALALIFTLGTFLFRQLPPVLTQGVAEWLRPQSCLGLLGESAPAPWLAGAAFGMAAEVILAMLVAWPLYAWMRRLAGPQSAAWAVGLYALTPGFGLWVSQFDRGVALFTPLILWCCERFVEARRLRDASLAGLIFSLATFITFGAVPIALIAIIYTAARLLGQSPLPTLLKAWRTWLAAVLCAAASTTTFWLAAWLWSGLNPFHLYQVVFDSHLGIEFPFWPFVFWHPWDLLTMTGLPLVGLTLTAGWRRALPVTLALFVTLAALSLAHVARSETGRVWLYFVPLFLGASGVIASALPRWGVALVLGLMVLQGSAQIGVLRVLIDYGIPPERYPKVTIPPDAVQIDTRFTADGAIALRAYRLESGAPGGEGQIVLYWERMSAQPVPHAYKAFVHVAADPEDQSRIAQHDEMPVRSKYPTTCWQRGQIVEDAIRMSIPPDAPPGEYRVFVGLYDPLTQQRTPAFASLPAEERFASILLPTRLTLDSAK